LRIADVIEPQLVQLADGIERIALELLIHPLRVGQVQNWFRTGAELHALMDSRQETAAPVGVAATGPLGTGAEDDKAGQILRLAAQAIGNPGADRWPAKLLEACVHQ